jgi:RNA polymerase sigma-70 factor (ECF subfamily)
MAADRTDKDDHELLARLQDGDHQAFGVLVRRHTERFYRLAYCYVQSKDIAEDIVQDAFLKLWEHPGRWQAERHSKFTTWFYRIVVNLCLDWQKKKRPLALPRGLFLADTRETPDTAMIRTQGRTLLEKEIAALPARQRTALNLCFDEALSNQEAAEVMGVHVKALQSLIMRAKARLKERMQRYV